jgi:hypothetical protein
MMKTIKKGWKHAPEGFQADVSVIDDPIEVPDMLAVTTVDPRTSSMRIVQALRTEGVVIGLGRIGDKGRPFVNLTMTFGDGALFHAMSDEQTEDLIVSLKQALEDMRNPKPNGWHSGRDVKRSIEEEEEENEPIED